MEKSAVKIRTMLEVWQKHIYPKIIRPEIGSRAEETTNMFGGLAGSNLRTYKPKTIIPAKDLPGNEIFKHKNPSLENLMESSNDLENSHMPSFQYHLMKGKKQSLGIEGGKIYLTRNKAGDPIRELINPKEYGASKKLTDLISGHHELSETKVKKPSMLTFSGHKSPEVIINENNALATLHRDNPGMTKSINSLQETMSTMAKIDPGRAYVANYVGGEYGKQKIPKAMKKYIMRQHHSEMKDELGTE